MTETKQIMLVKPDATFVFRYEGGCESQVLDALVAKVNLRDSSFDRFDAAVLSHQLGTSLTKELKGFVAKHSK